MATQGRPCDPLAMRIIMPAPNIVLFLNDFSSTLQSLGFRHNIFFMSSMQKHSSCVFHDSPHDMKTFQSELEPCRSQTYSPALRIIFKKVKKPSSPAYQLLSKLLLVSEDFSLNNR